MIRFKSVVLVVCLLTICHGLIASGVVKKDNRIPYKDATQPVEVRVRDLLGRMTIEEKVMQLNQYTLGWNNNENNIGKVVEKIPAEIGSLIYFSTDADMRNKMQRRAMEESRLGIPILFGFDVIHGFMTIYPISLAQGCSWNPDLVTRACRIAAQEAKMSGVDWTFSPMIDVSRDPRWGRVAEGYGEDPYANGVFGAASVKGYQGSSLDGEHSILSCLKHYVGYGASEAGRDYVYTEISRQTLWDTYLQPYKMCVDAGALSVMSSFNDISGVPGTANQYTMRDVLKGRWDFKGFVVSDWAAIMQLTNQGMAKDNKQAGMYAMNAGIDMDMMSHSYDEYLKQLVDEGAVHMKDVDDAVGRILEVKFRMGLFEHPYTPVSKPTERFLRKESLEIVGQLAAESMVLLKNDANVLPLNGQKRIAVIGPIAKDANAMLGSWSGHGMESQTKLLYDGIVSEYKDKAEVRYAEGCSIDGEDRSHFEEAKEVARWSDVVVLCLGESGQWSGENYSRSHIDVPEIQRKLLMELHGIGKPVVVLLSNGRPLELYNVEPYANAILEVWQPGTNGASAAAGILSGRINPSGRLDMTFPYNIGQIPIYYNRRKSARRGTQGLYKDGTSAPLYSFGYGLSYTSFQYGDIEASANIVRRGDKLKVWIPVTNIGDRDGAETVFWYVADPYSSITRPVKELKHFEKQTIGKGETRVFTFDIDIERDFSFVDNNGCPLLEDGDYNIIVNDKVLKIELVK